MYLDKKIVAIIPARAGSKRLPGKHARVMCGKNIIAWSIETALKVNEIDTVMVTTDDPAVEDTARRYEQVQIRKRPAYLATDEASSEHVLVNLLGELESEFDYGVLLQPTSPLRRACDIVSSLTMCLNNKKLTCASFVRLEGPSGIYFGAKDQCIQRLGDYDHLYMLNGAIYIFDIKRFMQTQELVTHETLVYEMPLGLSVDIDEKEDFDRAESVMTEILSSE